MAAGNDDVVDTDCQLCFSRQAASGNINLAVYRSLPAVLRQGCSWPSAALHHLARKRYRGFAVFGMLHWVQASFFHEGQGGTLYTWGGVNELCVYGANEKRDSNKGCLGHGEVDVYSGQLLPMR